jgi:hypothetical protein
MTNEQVGAEGLRLAASVLVLLLAYRFILVPAVIDYWRQQLFTLRNRLWDTMAELESLDEPAHQSLRARINAVIRLAPQVNLLFVWMLIRSCGDAVKGAEIGHQIAEVKNPAARDVLRSVGHELSRSLAWRVLFWSLPGALIGWPVAAVFSTWSGLTRLLRAVTGMPKRAVFGFRAALLRWWEAQVKEFEDRAVIAKKAEDLAQCNV